MTMRKKESWGSCHINQGITTLLDQTRYKIDYARLFYLFDIIPMGAVRMSSSDRWKTNPNHLDPQKRQRVIVTQYFLYKDMLRIQANQMKYQMDEFIDAVYFQPMPDSWSEKKKERMSGLPCKVKPDTDNITKGLKDTFLKNDSAVWRDIAEHRWAYKGSILIYG